ncbi:MAG TPA: hypothetical protein VJU61_04095 [Polyangiaceae bacterium]|nr:hypothetical protein [Polyangiaceae bacterium]
MRYLALPLTLAAVCGLSGCFGEGREERAAAANRSSWALPQPDFFSDDPSSSGLDGPVIVPRAVAVQMAEGLPVVAPQASTELAAFFPEGAQLVGVALDGRDESAPPYVLEAHRGLYRVTEAGAELVFDLRASRVLGGTGDGSPPQELTDIAFDRARSEASGKLTFAVTAENDGFALQLPGNTLESYFCYFPPTEAPVAGPFVSISQELREQGVPVVERTEAVAINELSAQIAAQPRTLRIDDGSVAGSELFAFDAAGGTPIGTWRLDRTDFVAGGAAFYAGSSLALGAGPDLYFTGGWGRDVYRQLSVQGATQITGLVARDNDDLLVLDGPSQRLLEVGVQQVVEALDGG